jgi:serine/threonine protein kinase
MNSTYFFLKKLGLLSINGHSYIKGLSNGSALSAIYSNGIYKIVVKFLINPRNNVELERFRLEYSVLQSNYINSYWTASGYKHFSSHTNYQDDGTYPLPKITVPIYHSHDNYINYFGYKYEEGVLLSDYDTSNFSLKEKVLLTTRVATALNYFTRSGYVHRDLHPNNILMLNSPKMYLVPPLSRVMILDLGNCQRDTKNANEDTAFKLVRDLDEDSVFNDNNKRILSSFTSMPPDFLTRGGNTKNYDAWAIGIYFYELIFGEKPFKVREIGDVVKLLSYPFLPTDVETNLSTLEPGLNIIVRSLLNINGECRPNTDAIVRLFNFYLDNEDFQHDYKGYARRILRDNGIDNKYRFED